MCFLFETPESRGSSQEREGGRGAGRMSAGNLFLGGGGLNISFSGSPIAFKHPVLTHYE